jgi:hypothetical protein
MLKKGVLRNCCGKFNAREVLNLGSAAEFSERYMKVGICPHCNSFVVEISKKYYNGRWVHECAKRKKAQKLYNKYKSDIVGEFQKNIKYGNKSNMGFRYGLNTEVIKNGKTTVKVYSVDFNGTKELISH